MGEIAFPKGQLFEIHGGKPKLHPVGQLSQAPALRIAHAVLFFSIGKHPLDLPFPQPV